MKSQEYLRPFLEKMGLVSLEEAYDKAGRFYLNEYGVMMEFPQLWLRKPSLLATPFKRIASLIETIGLREEHHFLFWIAKLYFVLPLPPEWKRVHISMNAIEYSFREVSGPFHPSIAFVLLLKHQLTADSVALHELKLSAKNNETNQIHFESDERAMPTISQFRMLRELRKLSAKQSGLLLNAQVSPKPKPVFTAETSLRVKNENTRQLLFKPSPLQAWPEEALNRFSKTTRKDVNARRPSLPSRNTWAANTVRSFKALNGFEPSTRQVSGRVTVTPRDETIARQFMTAESTENIKNAYKKLKQMKVNVSSKKLWQGLFVPVGADVRKDARLPAYGEGLLSFKS